MESTNILLLAFVLIPAAVLLWRIDAFRKRLGIVVFGCTVAFGLSLTIHAVSRLYGAADTTSERLAQTYHDMASVVVRNRLNLFDSEIEVLDRLVENSRLDGPLPSELINDSWIVAREGAKRVCGLFERCDGFASELSVPDQNDLQTSNQKP